MAGAGVLDALKSQRPEWVPWLKVVEVAVREAANPQWDQFVSDVSGGVEPGAPLITGITLNVDSSPVRRLLDGLIAAATHSGLPRMSALHTARRDKLDVLALLRASLCQQGTAGSASASPDDAEALDAVVALLGLPLLQACNRRWSRSIPAFWDKGYCAVCGAWPAFAEVRGIERTRYLRCGRCGGEWQASILRCGFCGTIDHNELVALVPEQPGAPAIDACRRCSGYVKTFTRLQGCAPADVMPQDLASVELDVAALEQGYMRPPGAGCTIDVTIAPAAGRRSFLAWQ